MIYKYNSNPGSDTGRLEAILDFAEGLSSPNYGRGTLNSEPEATPM